MFYPLLHFQKKVTKLYRYRTLIFDARGSLWKIEKSITFTIVCKMSFGETEVTALLPIWQQLKSILFPPQWHLLIWRQYSKENASTCSHQFNWQKNGKREPIRSWVKCLYFLESWVGARNWPTLTWLSCFVLCCSFFAEYIGGFNILYSSITTCLREYWIF